MLPATARLTDRDEFTTVVRRGRRSGRPLVVMHVLLPEPSDVVEKRIVSCDPDAARHIVTGVCATGAPAAAGCSRVGFVVSKAVGCSVVRHRVARRLRHLMRDRLVDVPDGSRVVVRALPASATADSASLGADLDRALRGALSARAARSGRSSSGRAAAQSTAEGTALASADIATRQESTPDQPAASSRS